MGAEGVAVLLVVVDVARVLEDPQQPQDGALVGPRRLGEFPQGRRTAGDEVEQPEGAQQRLAHPVNAGTSAGRSPRVTRAAAAQR